MLLNQPFFCWWKISLEKPLTRMGHVMFTNHRNKIWIVGGYGKNTTVSKGYRYLNNTLFFELSMDSSTRIQNSNETKIKTTTTVSIQSERASIANGSTVVDISTKPPSFKLVPLSSLRSPLSKTPKQVIF